MTRSNLFDYNDAYILVSNTGTAAVSKRETKK